MARIAHSLAQLRDEINAVAPKRSKVSDGWLGDAAHRSRASRHNPNSAGVVCALDITDDPAHGCPIHEIAERIRRNPHPNLEYMISNARTAGRSSNWQWKRYGGANPHRAHVHFGVGVGPDSEPRQPYDDRTPWGVAALLDSPQEDDMNTDELRAVLNDYFGLTGDPANPDGPKMSNTWLWELAKNTHGYAEATYRLVSDPDGFADAVVTRLPDGGDVDAATVREAVKQALREGTG